MSRQKEIILRVKSEFAGLKRLTVPISATLKELRDEVAAFVQLPLPDFQIWVEDKINLSQNDKTKLIELPNFTDGTLLVIRELKKRALKPTAPGTFGTSAESKCTHGPNGRCLNCPASEPAKGGMVVESDASKAKPSCSHGPSGKCLNCAPPPEK